MRLKSLIFVALLPVLTACGECARTMQFEGFKLSNATIPVPITINEERMPVSWRLLRENAALFMLTGRISEALDTKQFELCSRLKTAGDREKDALKTEYRDRQKDITELMDILQGPVPQIPQRLGGWNERLKGLAKEKTSGKGAVKKPEDAKPAPGAAPVPPVENTPEPAPSTTAPAAPAPPSAQ